MRKIPDYEKISEAFDFIINEIDSADNCYVFDLEKETGLYLPKVAGKLEKWRTKLVSSAERFESITRNRERFVSGCQAEIKPCTF